VTAYEDYIFDVATHFKGRLSGWDVVNEPILDDGSGLRSCLWRDLLGDDYIDRAYRVVRAVEPTLPLALNDYSLEYSPTKRRQFLKLVDGMLKRGTPLDVLGSQTHLSTDQAPGAITAALKDLAATGLKIHISEIDISLNGSVFSQFDLSAQRERQYRLLSELTEAFVALPSAQQFGMTVWGLRDKDSWLTRTKNDAFTDEPLWFDNKGRPKRLIEAFVSAL
jgi:endo-1,4-beta-xylanase